MAQVEWYPEAWVEGDFSGDALDDPAVYLREDAARRDYELGEIETGTFKGRPAASAQYTNPDSGAYGMVVVMFTRQGEDDVKAIYFVFARSREFDAALKEAIAGFRPLSLDLRDPALPRTPPRWTACPDSAPAAGNSSP